jgi:hypothetical protein
MLSWFRTNAKIFLIAVVVIFVVMIFVNWGRGMSSSAARSRFVVARIDGKDMLPDNYDAARSQVYSMLETEMTNSGDPSPTNELTLMFNEINRMAFDRMVDSELREKWLRSMDWPMPGPDAADAMLLDQLRLAGIPEPEEYLERYRNDPNYNMMLYQLFTQAVSRRFPAAVSLLNMTSSEEVEFQLLQKYAPITARYIAFRAMPEVPTDSELADFYYMHKDLFAVPPGATVRYVTVLVQPSDADEEWSRMMVDSLALSGTAQPDSIIMTREQLQAFAGREMDLEPGDYSMPFAAASLSNPGFPAAHSVKLVSLSPSSGGDADAGNDTLALLHWEIPVFPGYDTVRNTFWDVEEAMDSLLAESIPWSDSLLIADWGEFYIDSTTATGYQIPPTLKAFALDSIWADETGPVFYIPSFGGGYPALMVARKLDSSAGGQMTLEEARLSGRLFEEAYTRRQAEASLLQAAGALTVMTNTGVSLGMYAASESLTIESTPEFTASAVRANTPADGEGLYGILSCEGFADAALLAPQLQPIGPFVSGGTAYLAEISTRMPPQLPDDPVLMAPAYLSTEQTNGTAARDLMTRELRDNAEIVDLRDQYYATIDSLRAAQPDSVSTGS